MYAEIISAVLQIMKLHVKTESLHCLQNNTSELSSSCMIASKNKLVLVHAKCRATKTTAIL